MSDPIKPIPGARSFPVVHGRCPSCGGGLLFLGDGGFVTCARPECPNPEAVSQVLQRLDRHDAPIALHEGLDRVWAAMQSDESGLTTLEGDDVDEYVQEALRGLTFEDLRRAGFALQIVRMFTLLTRPRG